MEWLDQLATRLPNLRTKIQLIGLIVIVVAGMMMVTDVGPEQVQGKISLGAIGILLLIFAQLFDFIGTRIPEGERGPLLVKLVQISLIFIIALVAVTSYFFLRDPLDVVMLDTYARVYDPQDKAAHRYNGAKIVTLIDDLPVKPDPRLTYEGWVEQQCESVREMNPELVIVHQSAFCPNEEKDADCHDSDEELIDFFRCMQNTKSRFLVYTRYRYGELVRLAAETRVPSVKGRIFTFPMTRRVGQEYKEFTFSDPTIRREFKQKVRSLLDL